MRKKNGFTLIELLAVMIILALLIVLMVPSFTSIYTTVKRQNYQSKITEVNAAAQKYGATIKDEVKDADNHCLTVTIAKLIEQGLLDSEDDRRAIIYDPTTAKPMEGAIEICYCKSTFDIQSFYAEDFNSNTIYHKGDYVRDNKITYKVLEDTVTYPKITDTKYFERLAC